MASIPPLYYECADCGKPKRFWPSEISGPCARYSLFDGVYYCKKCSYRYRRNKVAVIGTIDLVCSDCGKVRKAYHSEDSAKNDHYLCRKCYFLALKENRHPQHALAVGFLSVTCPDCGIVMAKRPFEIAKKSTVYCKRCFYKHLPKRGKGRAKCYYPPEFSTSLRNEIRTRDGNRCFLCKRRDRKKTHHVHHIDHNKMNCSKDNLITLCRYCHPHIHATKNADQWKIRLHAMVLAKYGLSLYW